MERLASQFISALHTHTGTPKDVLRQYNLCDRCGMDDKAPEVMLCECCKDKAGETCSCRTCIPAVPGSDLSCLKSHLGWDS